MLEAMSGSGVRRGGRESGLRVGTFGEGRARIRDRICLVWWAWTMEREKYVRPGLH